VSVICPISEWRRGFIPQLLQCFFAQTWQDKELIIIDTHRSVPNPLLEGLAKEHPSLVVYCHFRAEFSIGLKRNMGLHMATGTYVVHFDDDDLYSPIYLDTMIKRMMSQGLAALTLSAWYDCDVVRGALKYVDPLGESPTEDIEKAAAHIVYGYGFSYAFLRAPALENVFPDVSLSEDYIFMVRLQKNLGFNKVGLLRDERGICLHIKHGGNTSGVDEHLDVVGAEARKLAVWALDVYDPRIRRFGPEDAN